MTLHDIETSGMPQHYNLQNIFTVQVSNKVKQYSIEKALDLVHEKPYAAHDALNDAMSTVLLCNHLDTLSPVQYAYKLTLPSAGFIVTKYRSANLIIDATFIFESSNEDIIHQMSKKIDNTFQLFTIG